MAVARHPPYIAARRCLLLPAAAEVQVKGLAQMVGLGVRSLLGMAGLGQVQHLVRARHKVLGVLLLRVLQAAQVVEAVSPPQVLVAQGQVAGPSAQSRVAMPQTVAWEATPAVEVGVASTAAASQL